MFLIFCALREISLLQEMCLNIAQNTGCLSDLHAFSSCFLLVQRGRAFCSTEKTMYFFKRHFL